MATGRVPLRSTPSAAEETDAGAADDVDADDDDNEAELTRSELLVVREIRSSPRRTWP